MKALILALTLLTLVACGKPGDAPLTPVYAPISAGTPLTQSTNTAVARQAEPCGWQGCQPVQPPEQHCFWNGQMMVCE